MKLLQLIEPIDNTGHWNYAIVNDHNQLACIGGGHGTNGFDDPSTVERIWFLSSINNEFVSRYLYKVIVEDFETLEELKNLRPELFI
jgi:hypothetical protein